MFCNVIQSSSDRRYRINQEKNSLVFVVFVTAGVDPPGPALLSVFWGVQEARGGARLARVVGLPLSPSGIGADLSTSLRGLANDPIVAAAGGRVPVMAVVSISPGISSKGGVQLR